MSEKIDEILADLGPAYVGWKENETKKEKLKKEFFEAITEALTDSETLAEKVVEIEADSIEDARILVEQRYPTWDVEADRPHNTDEGSFEFILKENPAFQPYSVTYEGVEFNRQVAAGAVMLDDERLKKEDKELWNEVTYVPEPKRKLRSIEDLPPETQAKIQDYLYEGKPQVKFPPPKAKDE